MTEKTKAHALTIIAGILLIIGSLFYAAEQLIYLFGSGTNISEYVYDYTAYYILRNTLTYLPFIIFCFAFNKKPDKKKVFCILGLGLPLINYFVSLFDNVQKTLRTADAVLTDWIVPGIMVLETASMVILLAAFLSSSKGVMITGLAIFSLRFAAEIVFAFSTYGYRSYIESSNIVEATMGYTLIASSIAVTIGFILIFIYVCVNSKAFVKSYKVSSNNPSGEIPVYTAPVNTYQPAQAAQADVYTGANITTDVSVSQTETVSQPESSNNQPNNIQQ